MSKQEALHRHQIIIKKLRRNPCTFEEILSKLRSESELYEIDLEISKRTFQRDVKEIAALYKIEIKFNRTKKAYYISDDIEDTYSDRLFEALDVFQLLNLNQTISQFIQFKPRKSTGTENLNGLLHAIQNRYQIQFRYEKFFPDEIDSRKVEPYLLKEFKDRWYVLAYDLEKKDFRTFGLDRIYALQILPIKFQHPQTMDPKLYYKNSFGIVGPSNGEPQDIILKLTNSFGEYIRTLPLHTSQEILEEDGRDMLIKLHLIPTYDFVFELMSMGANLKVLEPQSLADELKNRFKSALELYADEVSN
ncbi:MAG: WYL domain-containing protein [Weeksellaceae bacterium]